jgi:predicted enzyme related to lactoylglutathione lyase
MVEQASRRIAGVMGTSRFRAQIIKAAGKISRDIFSFPGGGRFHYVDPAGNELGVWSDV